MQLLDGKIIAKEIKAEVLAQAEGYRQQAIVPTLAIVVATENPSSLWYVRSICKAAEACKIATKLVQLAATSTTADIAHAVAELDKDDDVHGIILQTPLPAAVAVDQVLGFIPPAKDVDGANPLSAGNLVYGTPAFPPATAAAVLKILDYYQIALAGKQVAVIGRSRIVGKPVAHLLLQRDATVTICHRYTAELKLHTLPAEVLVVAAGRAGIITPDMIKPGAIVIDVGTNVTEDGSLIGDVEPNAIEVAGGLTPVPGGVGPVTTALILQHTITAVGLLQN